MNTSLKGKLRMLAAALCLATTAAAQAPDDWANFARFEQENAAQTTAPRAVLMGNSITEGWIGKHPDFFARNGFVSRAISGQTTSQMLVRFRAAVIELHPKIVVICGGTNDLARNTGYISPEHILDNIQSMVDLARANGIRPILCSIHPTGDYPWRPGIEPAQKIIRLNAAIRAYAEQEGIPYVDYHTPMAAGDGSMIAAYTNDGVHPNEAGYEVMERILPPVVDRLEAEIDRAAARAK